jgi:hypothetical protein
MKYIYIDRAEGGLECLHIITENRVMTVNTECSIQLSGDVYCYVNPVNVTQVQQKIWWEKT